MNSHYNSSNGHGQQTLNPWQNKPIFIPIETPSNQTLTPIPVHLPSSYLDTKAVKIQSVYRGHLVRSFIRTIRAVDYDSNRIERMIQRQETVDAIRDVNSVQRVRLNEMLMKSLLRLDSVPGFYPAVRELRRNLSRRIVGLQEILDAIAMAEMREREFEGIPSSLEEILVTVCKQGKWS